jgi:predicted outer membrane lipoprotein
VGAAIFPAGILELIAPNGVSLGFNLGLAAIFLLALGARLKPIDPRLADFARSAPSSLVGVGLLGVLIGALMGLRHFDAPALGETTPPLIGALESACFTGILGLTLAAAFRVLQGALAIPETEPGTGSGGAGSEPRGEASEANLQAQLAGEVESRLVPHLDKLARSLADPLEEIRRELGERLAGVEAAPEPAASQVVEVAEAQPEAPAEAPAPEPPSEADNLPARRFKLKIPVDYMADRRGGQGTIVNLSSTGALVREATSKPRIGALIKLSYSCDGPEDQTTILGEVVRHAGTGFAVQFDNADTC